MTIEHKGMKIKKWNGEVVVMNAMREEEEKDIPDIGEKTREVRGNRIVTGFCFVN